MDYNLQKNQNAEQTYHSIRNSIVSAQHRLSTVVNSAMVTTYWEIGEQIFKACGENDRAEYGKKLLDYLSKQLTAEFGKGFDKSNLRKMRQFYCTFPIRDTLCPELSWSHYRVLMRINDEQARRFYMEECAKADVCELLTREMMNEGDTQPIGIVLCADKGDSIVKYTLPEDNHQIFASKYFTYLPSEEELKRELNLKEFHKKE